MDGWLDKENVTHAYTMEYYAAVRNKEILPFTTVQTDLEGIMVSEISHTGKRAHCVIPFICGI